MTTTNQTSFLTSNDSDSPFYVVGESSGFLIDNRVADKRVDVMRDLAGIIILVHGVNDVGESYAAQEAGLCAGLNERLYRDDMVAGEYKLPKRDDKLSADPDAVYYRRDAGNYRSPVIPFYWGYRAIRRKNNIKEWRGQNVDLQGNRLDKQLAIGGGMFANATSEIPSMFKGHHVRTPLAASADLLNGDPFHPLRTAADRKYMVLAAKRLAMLIAAIRKVGNGNDTVTLVGHSQGCLLSLLAQAFLDQDGERAADCLILNHPPYSLHEPIVEGLVQNTRPIQQTTFARLQTLVALVRKVTDKAHGEPPLAELICPQKSQGRCGPQWTPDTGKRRDPTQCGKELEFRERDNRGKVYLYFCPGDQTVGLPNVKGIGNLGVPDEMIALSDEGVFNTSYAPMSMLGKGFFQRIWTMRERDGKREPVGKASPYRYLLRAHGEDAYPDASPGRNALLTAPKEGETRTINGEALNPPCTPDLCYGETAKGQLAVDPINAAIATANNASLPITETIEDPRSSQFEREKPNDPMFLLSVERAVNVRRPDTDQVTVTAAELAGEGRLTITRTETGEETRERLGRTGSMKNSYHSSIVGNPDHSRYVTAMDVALGQAKSLDDPDRREMFNMIADWRTPFDKLEQLKEFKTLCLDAAELVVANCEYYRTGEFPAFLTSIELPPGVTSETRRQRSDQAEKSRIQIQARMEPEDFGATPKRL